MPDPVVVTPIPASESRTLRLAWLTTVWTTILGFLPDLVELLLNLLVTDPRFAAAVADWFPRPLRYGAMAVLIGYAQKQRQLRRDTVAPISGTFAAEWARHKTDNDGAIRVTETAGGNTNENVQQ